MSITKTLRALHRPVGTRPTQCTECVQNWPCRTIQAVNAIIELNVSHAKERMKVAQ